MGYRVGRIVAWAGIGGLLAACSQTTRVDEDTSTDQLAKSGKAVAVMRLGMASPSCQHVGVWLGTREGQGYRPQKPVAVMFAGSLEEVPVAEVELQPGEYHVISYACGTGQKTSQVTNFDRTSGLARQSYASFTVAAGEVVNVGSFEFHASRVGLNAFGRPIRSTVSVTDWPLADLDRYKTKRPAIYAQMKTRLMTVTDRGAREADEGDCSQLRQLKADGKLQNLPAMCAEPAAAAAAKTAGKAR